MWAWLEAIPYIGWGGWGIAFGGAAIGWGIIYGGVCGIWGMCF